MKKTKVCHNLIFFCILTAIFSSEAFNINLKASEPQYMSIEGYPSKMKFENGRIIMEDLPPEMLGEENSQWIKELLSIFGMNLSDADIQYGENSLSFKSPGCGGCIPRN